jgi:nucleoside-triphosphatase
MQKTNILITGSPGVGKTTLLQKICRELEAFCPSGFITREIRKEGKRQGFQLIGLQGGQRTLAHTRIAGQAKVGKYGVDVQGLEAYLQQLDLEAAQAGFIAIDEIGKMECLSAEFVSLMRRLLDSERPLLATVAAKGKGFIKEVKARQDAALISVNEENRQALAGELVRRMQELLESCSDNT